KGARRIDAVGQGAIVWNRACPPLDSLSHPGIHDSFVTPGRAADRLVCSLAGASLSGCTPHYMRIETMHKSNAEVIREYGPLPGIGGIHGVTWDGRQVWFATDGRVNALDPDSGKVLRSIDVPA